MRHNWSIMYPDSGGSPYLICACGKRMQSEAQASEDYYADDCTSQVFTYFDLKKNAWSGPIAYECPTCRAMLRDDAGMENHAAWHEAINNYMLSPLMVFNPTGTPDPGPWAMPDIFRVNK